MDEPNRQRIAGRTSAEGADRTAAASRDKSPDLWVTAVVAGLAVVAVAALSSGSDNTDGSNDANYVTPEANC
jgi:hypothetical protein